MIQKFLNFFFTFLIILKDFKNIFNLFLKKNPMFI